MVVNMIYPLLCVVALPFWIAQQHLGGRSILFILATSVYALYFLVAGVKIPVDNLTLIVGYIAAWSIFSLVWTTTRNSAFELLNILSYLILFMAARAVPLEITVLAVFSVGAIFSTIEISRIVKNRKLPPVDGTFVIGNGNHTGTLMLINIFTGLYLMVYMSYWFIPFILSAVFILFASRCKGAWIAFIVGTVTLFIKEYCELWPLLVCILYILAGILIVYFLFYSVNNMIYNRHSRFFNLIKTSLGGRVWLHLAALEMIIKKPVTGWGFNSYQVELPEIIKIIKSTALYTRIKDKFEANMNTRSHRAHNDHLEIMAEIGIIGYFLFAYLFSNIDYNPFIFCLLVAFLIHACFFFPFREVHTAAPFWAIMGSMAGGTVSIIAIPLLAKALIAFAVVAVIIQTLHKFLGQWFSEMAKNKPGITNEKRREYTDIAIIHDPHNGGYLSDGAYMWSKVDPVKAFFYVARGLFLYDGCRVKYGIYDLFARCLIAAGLSNVCHTVENEALKLNPEFEPAKVINEYLYNKASCKK
jgi:O-antigen ligase